METDFCIDFSLMLCGDDHELLLPYCGTIKIWNENTERYVKVGQVVVLVALRGEAMDCGESLASAMDDEHHEEVFTYVLDQWDDLVDDMYGGLFGVNLLVIKSIEIGKKYRGRGLGYATVKRIIKTIGQSCGLVALKPFPVQWEGRAKEDEKAYRRDLKKIREYWERFGFRQVSDSNVYTYSPELAKQPPLHKRHSAK